MKKLHDADQRIGGQTCFENPEASREATPRQSAPSSCQETTVKYNNLVSPLFNIHNPNILTWSSIATL
jgi:hypothetical protein